MAEQRPVGRVIASEHSTTQEFRVVLNDDSYLQLDDMVMLETEVPGAGTIRTYGVVTESEGFYEGAAFESDTFRIAGEGILPAAKMRSARVAVTRVDPELWVAPDPGAEVYRAAGGERDKALYKDEMERPLPVGIGRDGEPVYADLDFFDGRKGGHMSGISGVATKTSYALFFLRMLTAHPEILGEGAANLRVLVFNVKGEDLLWLDHPNRRLDGESIEEWNRLGVEPDPFRSVRFWAPPRPRSGGVILPHTGGRQEGVDAFAWTPREFIEEGLLSFLFTDASDYRNQVAFVEERVRSQLLRWAVDVAGEAGAVVLREPPPGGRRGAPQVVPDPGERVIRTLADLVEDLGERLDPPDGSEPDQAWSGRTQQGTISAFMRRLHAASHRLGHLIRAGESRRIDRAAARVTVVSIQSLHDLGQRFVVGALLKEAFDEKEQSGRRLPLSVIVLDELNKYAPREGRSPLKEMLIDIAQRGRSLGVLLVGAQQTASRVAPEVLENAALRVAGRLDAAEAERSEYGWMLPSTKARARLLKPGTMVLSQPAIPVPLVLTFPFPAWATRQEEAEEQGDPFEGL